MKYSGPGAYLSLQITLPQPLPARMVSTTVTMTFPFFRPASLKVWVFPVLDIEMTPSPAKEKIEGWVSYVVSMQCAGCTSLDSRHSV